MWDEDLKAQKADGTITLIKSEKIIIVDTGLPKDKDIILQGLKKHGVSVEDVNFVIYTHGDADHISNNNLFPTAKLIVGFDIYDGDVATFFQKNYHVDKFVTATEMTGHDDRSIGILVQTKEGLAAICGDLFEYENDWQNAKDWMAFSKRPKDRIANRAKVWELADYIVPGHGDIFKVNKSVNILQEEKRQLKELLQKSVNVYGDVEL